MAKQIRYGEYKDFKPEKMVTAELACVVSGDPAVSDGRSVYVCFTPGIVKRLTTYADFERELAAESEEIRSQFTQDIKDAIKNALDATNKANTATAAANKAADDIKQAAANGDYSATIESVSVVTGEPGTEASVTNTGTKQKAAFKFTIPKGVKGDKGDKGDPGEIENLSEQEIIFTSADELNPSAWSAMPGILTAKEKLNSILNKISIVTKNVRFLGRILGNTNIAEIGDGTVTSALAALMADKLNRTDIVNDLLSTAEDKALSAAMGKKLQDAVNQLNTYTLKGTRYTLFQQDEVTVGETYSFSDNIHNYKYYTGVFIWDMCAITQIYWYDNDHNGIIFDSARYNSANDISLHRLMIIIPNSAPTTFKVQKATNLSFSNGEISFVDIESGIAVGNVMLQGIK